MKNNDKNKSKIMKTSMDQYETQLHVGPVGVVVFLDDAALSFVPRVATTAVARQVTQHPHSSIEILMMKMTLLKFCRKFLVILPVMLCIIGGNMMKKQMNIS